MVRCVGDAKTGSPRTRVSRGLNLGCSLERLLGCFAFRFRQHSVGARKGLTCLRFRTIDYVRDWLPIRRERCGSRGSRTSDGDVLREADRDPVAAVAKRHGVATDDLQLAQALWDVSGGRRAASEQLEHETRGSELVAERDLEIEVMGDQRKMVSVPARRGQVVYATGRGLSQRRACTLVQVGRSALQYRSGRRSRTRR